MPQISLTHVFCSLIYFVVFIWFGVLWKSYGMSEIKPRLTACKTSTQMYLLRPLFYLFLFIYEGSHLAVLKDLSWQTSKDHIELQISNSGCLYASQVAHQLYYCFSSTIVCLAFYLFSPRAPLFSGTRAVHGSKTSSHYQGIRCIL